MSKWRWAFCLILICSSAPALACSYIVDDVKKSEEFKNIAAGYLGGVILVKAELVKFDFQPGNPAQICPKPQSYTATLDVNFVRDGRPCNAQVDITQADTPSTDKSVYSVSGLNTVRCGSPRNPGGN